MARCCGGGTQCGCLIQAGARIIVDGTGTSQDPFVISGDTSLTVLDTSVFDLALTGLGTTASPWVLQLGYASTAKLDDIPDVNAPAPTNGQVLGWDSATSKWTARAPTTAASGSVLTDTSLTGDGSSGSHLAVRENTSGFIQTTSTGIGLTDAGVNQMVRHFANASTRAIASPAPVLNSVSVLDSNPGQQDYWTGTQWLPVTAGIPRSFGAEMLALSGSYVAGLPVTLITRNITFTTDTIGTFDILSAVDLSAYSGVLAVSFQETGPIAYKAMAYPDLSRIAGAAYRIDDGTLYASQTLTGSLVAWVY